MCGAGDMETSAMIKGIGVDVVEIRRIREMIRKYGDHFLQKVFTPAEVAYCEKAAVPEIHFAGRWAVKEAFYKALPRECQTMSGWKSVEIVPGESMVPMVLVCSDFLKSGMDKCGIERWLASISHEKQVCVGVVVMDGKE
jgi:holo-[acyl-carrier protein] synthase